MEFQKSKHSKEKHNIRGYIVFYDKKIEHETPNLGCCYTCDIRRGARKDFNIEYLYSLVMFTGKDGQEIQYFQENPSLNVIANAFNLLNLPLEHAISSWLDSNIQIMHFAYNHEYNCYVFATMHSFPPPPAVYKNSIWWEYEVQAHIQIHKIVKMKRDFRNQTVQMTQLGNKDHIKITS